MIIGWRGEPGNIDEPQHNKIGSITKTLLDVVGISYDILDPNNYQKQIIDAKLFCEKNQQPYAIIVRPDLFESYELGSCILDIDGLVREQAIQNIVESIDPHDLILSTTGKTSRELYEVCEIHPRGHDNNFYNVGSMGHVSAIGLEVALHQNNKVVYVLDGDGAMIMHMGSLATIGHYQPNNLIHIIFDNNSHESTGGQPTVSETIDIPSVLKACNYKNVSYIHSKSELSDVLLLPNQGLTGIVVQIKKGSRKNLGRPSDSPKKTKIRFMEKIVNGSY